MLRFGQLKPERNAEDERAEAAEQTAQKGVEGEGAHHNSVHHLLGYAVNMLVRGGIDPIFQGKGGRKGQEKENLESGAKQRED